MMMKYSVLAIVIALCHGVMHAVANPVDNLKLAIVDVVNRAPGSIGVAFVAEGDTVMVNNGARYGMMSVFKLHESLAVAKKLDSENISLDTILNISATELDHETWSPMLKEYGNSDFSISVGQLIDYAISVSDNNASNLMFKYIVTPDETDSIIRSMAADKTFSIKYTEGEMKGNHDRCYCNFTSPLSAALLIKKVFTEQLVSTDKQEAIKKALTSVTTGADRIGSALPDVPGIIFGHKTGSGYRNIAGELMAHNDIAYIKLPDGRDYALAVLVRDFYGSEAEASAVISELSAIVYNWMLAPK